MLDYLNRSVITVALGMLLHYELWMTNPSSCMFRVELFCINPRAVIMFNFVVTPLKEHFVMCKPAGWKFPSKAKNVLGGKANVLMLPELSNSLCWTKSPKIDLQPYLYAMKVFKSAFSKWSNGILQIIF